ncbi:MAG TPA: RNA methyltransferase [Candidatus Paceibacterota bacterium]|nr:RNA methyltransferase [Candidatus Paceibacterota bacterium]
MYAVSVLLHNVRSAHNVGSIFRTADAAGVTGVYLSGYTPRPIDRFGRIQKDIAKTALGAERSVAWEYATSPHAHLKKMRAQGFQIIGVEQDHRSRDYRSFRATKPALFIFGNEVRGLSHALRDECDMLLEIPMRGSKESLNVAVAAGIVLFNTRTR